jgi:hypothetical protein
MNLRQAAVDFTGNVASGTLTYIYRIHSGGVPQLASTEYWRAVATVTFTAQRVQ